MTGDLLGGRYRRERKLGAGAMGEVWLAEDVLLGRKVAIKNVASTGILSGLATPVQEDLLLRIRREAKLAARLNHPNAVAVYDLVVVAEQPYVVMEYVPGVSFAEEISGRTLDPGRVAEVGGAVADALADAHAMGIVHRDVKPANVLIGPRGTPKLADFGIARVTDDPGGTGTGVMLGTPAFVAPEVAHGAPASAASDVWSLGITLYAALEGRSPFQQTGDDGVLVVLGRVLNGAVRPPSRGGRVADVVMRMLQLDPARRPDAAAAAALLRGEPAAPPARPGEPLDGTTRRRPVLVPPVPVAPVSVPPVPVPPVPSRPFSVPPTELNPVAARSAGYGERTQLRDLVPPPAAPRRRGLGPILAGAGAVALIAVITVVAVLLTGRSSSPQAAATPSRTAPAPAPPATVTAPPSVLHVTLTETHQVTAPAVPVSPPTSASKSQDGLTAYSYADGLNTVDVQGPVGFYLEPDTAEITASSHWHDYVYLDADDRWHEPYLHLGVGNPHPTGSIHTEAEGSRAALLRNKHFYDIDVQPATYTTYCGVTAADIEYTETRHQYEDVPRHGKLRIWQDHGETLIVEIDAPAAQWSRWSGYFDTMVSTCAA